MKIRLGFISNSSTASFIVKTRPTEWDVTLENMGEEDIAIMTLSQDKIDLLKKCGFVPTKEENPFRKDLNENLGDYDVKADTDDDALLGFWMTCNHLDVIEFLIANDIPFKASVHYGENLYSYDPEDGYVYILSNFGIEYMRNPKELEEAINNSTEGSWPNIKPLEKVSKEDMLKDYNEEDAIKMMTGKY